MNSKFSTLNYNRNNKSDVYLSKKENAIYISQTNHPRIVSEFIKKLNSGIISGMDEFTINIECKSSSYPDVCVPIAGIVQFWKQRGINFTFKKMSDFISNTNIHQPLEAKKTVIDFLSSPTNKIWYFHSSDGINLLVDRFISEVSQVVECQKGVIEGLTWCLNEVMDNVLIHSKADRGFVMGQIHSNQKHLAFCVFDYGQGIYNSFKGTVHQTRYPLDAITLSIKEGVTRDKSNFQGNGLWGLHNILRLNSGRLAITSHTACYILQNSSDIRHFSNIPIFDTENGFTIVDFQIDYDKGISITESLGGHIPVNYQYELMENEIGLIVFKISEKASGTGTRQSGERLRNEVINISTETNKVIVIDFEGVSVISSSFADELFGKLVAKYGFFGFNQKFRLKNMNETVQAVLNRSVSQRMAETFV